MKTKLRTKLLLGFIAVAFIGTIIGVIGVINIKSIDDADTKLYDKITVPISNLLKITESFQQIEVNVRDLVDAVTLEEKNKISATINDLSKIIVDNAAEYEKTILDDAEKKDFKDFLDARIVYRGHLDEIINFVKAGKIKEARDLLEGEGKKAASAEQAAIDKLVILNENQAKQVNEENNKIASLSSTIMISAIILGLIISLFLAIWLGVYVISKPLIIISDTLKNSSGQIALASTQLSSSSQEIAGGATEQASSIEETTSSMEELASMVKQNVGNAQEASTLAEKAASSSDIGHNQMESMLSSMTDINKASEQIKKVIKVIDDIAFQTNILALNAAVEAARAGEAGMGFAVVADEVKNLANKSAEAAKETANIIEDSIKKTEAGLQTATKLTEIFKDILTTAKKVAEMSKEVETASKQQDSGINQVNKAIVQFDEVVQANASSAEETASSAEELLAQVESLNDIVAKLILLVTGNEMTQDTQSVRHAITENRTVINKKESLAHTNVKKQITNLAGLKAKKKREVTPEDVIPFEEDEEFKSVV
jgi:methyl-accepting chemotaxis protein